MAYDSLSPPILAAVELIATRINAAAEVPWLLGGGVAQVLGGVETAPISEVLVLTGAAEVARVAALLDADELEPLAMRPAAGFASSPRGRYRLPIGDGSAAVTVTLVGDVIAVGRYGTLSLSLERVWPLRTTWKSNAGPVPLVPLEIELVSELLRGQTTQAHGIASYLLARGARWDQLDLIMATVPDLEEALWELMDEVRPLGKRARGRRIRRQSGWGGKRR